MKRFITFAIILCLMTSCFLPLTVASSFAAAKDPAYNTSSYYKAEAEPSSADADGESSSDDADDRSSDDAEAGSSDQESRGAGVIEPAGESTPEDPVGDSTSYYDMDSLDGAPDITAESAILMDATTGAVLYSKQADAKRYPASITKTMTALLVIENCNLDETVTFSKDAVYGVEGSSAGINAGAQISVEDALYAMMLVSANESAAALAEHVSGSVSDFADLMNKRAKELGCTRTHFVNPHGLPDENHLTTAHDMALILRQAMKYEDFRTIAGTITYTIEKNDTLKNTLELWNHAKILRDNSEYYYKYAEGSKTGFTQAAHNTLVTYAKKDHAELICVILKDYGADCSYQDTKALFQWGFKHVKGIRPLADLDLKKLISDTKDIDKARKKSYLSLKTSFNEDYYTLVPSGFDKKSLKYAFKAKENKEKNILGYIYILSGKDKIGKTPVTYEGSISSDPSEMISGDDDGLETAPNSDNSLTPTKVLKTFLKIVAAVILIVLVMTIIRMIIHRKRRVKDYGRRKKARSNNKE